MNAICNEGCQLEFSINGFVTVDISNEVEKTYFECEHCKHEYIVFYTDPEIRDLQEQIRQVHRGMLEPDGQAAAIEKEEEIKALIKEKMDALKERIMVLNTFNVPPSLWDKVAEGPEMPDHSITIELGDDE